MGQKRPRLGDFCPDNRPQIPDQLIRCVVAIESNFIRTPALYRAPGFDFKCNNLILIPRL
jgi:hypothetical protein